jgi:hypothetical protein
MILLKGESGIRLFLYMGRGGGFVLVRSRCTNNLATVTSRSIYERNLENNSRIKDEFRRNKKMNDTKSFCSGKRIYAKVDAEATMNYLLREGKADALRIYSCSWCNFWHLTRQVYPAKSNRFGKEQWKPWKRSKKVRSA